METGTVRIFFISTWLLLVPHLLLMLLLLVVFIGAKLRTKHKENVRHSFRALPLHTVRWFCCLLQVLIHVAAVIESILCIFDSRQSTTTGFRNQLFYLFSNLIAVLTIILALWEYYCLEIKKVCTTLPVFISYWLVVFGCSVARLIVIRSYTSSVHFFLTSGIVALSGIQLTLDIYAIFEKVCSFTYYILGILLIIIVYINL